ncbi:hypothetical protein SAMN05444920_11357 [Nonomuraea solani]|uniref:TPM domain-containing protein n=1 Tax=Nonomuraea solani TaxID=1144553 RepID=A0A1H6ENP9_9ACTN|nr:hypothetical protein [Nonomuraea solani]SEG99457.1 hypothetical protein SAMN05444920_11357 [Nonomuraea solani]
MTHSLRRAGAAIAALITGLIVVLALSPAANAAAPPDAKSVASNWTKAPLYTVPGSELTSDQQSEINDALKGASSKIYAVALPDGSVDDSTIKTYMTQLNTELSAAGRNRATIAVIDGTTLFAGSSALRQTGLAGELANRAVNANSGDLVAGMKDFANRVDSAAEGKTKAALDPGSQANPGAGGTAALIALGGLVVVGGGGYFLYSSNKKKKRAIQEAKDLAAVKQTVEEDVTKLGEEITALDTDVTLAGDGGKHIDEWQTALDSYEKAKTQLNAVQRPDEVREVTQTLEDGRYALAVVKAKVNNDPVPERRAPCFFNPQHGPSTRDVRWAPPGGAARDVPACKMDAEAVERGFDPQMREVMVDGQRRPYYDAGPAYQPYAYGYYGGFGDIMTGMFIGTMMGSMLSGGFGYGGGYADGGGADAGGGDFGGGDGGGGWGDFGGGDFGGGDW